MDSASPTDERHMLRALALAAQGRGRVEPNPMVGAVVVNAAGAVVGEGWHEFFGGPHAEVNALAAAGNAALGGTLYDTLEPCCHHGKTPPCTEAVLKSGVRRVVVAMGDPFPAVAGGGLSALRDKGLSVEVGVCESNAARLNAPYLTLLHRHRPWVIAKWATSLDGRIATRTGDSKWISNEASRAKVHDLRGRVDAILVGRGTLLADDPLLTARPAGPRIATRIIVSASGELPESCQLLRTIDHAPVLVATTREGAGKLASWERAGAEILVLRHIDVLGSEPDALATLSRQTSLTRPALKETIPNHLCDQALVLDGPMIEGLLAELGRRRMTNVLVEGGGGLLGSFRDAGAIDEVHAFVAPKLIGGDKALSPLGAEGISAISDASLFEDVEAEVLDRDVWIVARRTMSDRIYSITQSSSVVPTS